jgi:hypothetical protein
LLNARLNQCLSVDKQSEKMVRLLCVNYSDMVFGATVVPGGSEVVPQIGTYLIKTKTAEVGDSKCVFLLLSFIR